MQDAVQAIGSGAGRIFAGVGAGDRRLRPQSHHHHHQQAALKCPRCESLNTKFCYYNNYNLSQPRHFCKSCRRYWTKGGVLRNVPVGGGCRKAKRSTSSAKAAKVKDQITQSIVQLDNSPISIITETSSTAHDKTVREEEPPAGISKTQPIEQATEGLNWTSSAEDIYHMMNTTTTTTSYCGNDEDEFMKAAVDYGGDSTLFDITAAVDPSYWNYDQPTSLNFLP